MRVLFKHVVIGVRRLLRKVRQDARQRDGPPVQSVGLPMPMVLYGAFFVLVAVRYCYLEGYCQAVRQAQQQAQPKIVYQTVIVQERPLLNVDDITGAMAENQNTITNSVSSDMMLYNDTSWICKKVATHATQRRNLLNIVNEAPIHNDVDYDPG
jgi:hypothetical protein